MKYNKKELLAIESLCKLAESLKECKTVVLTSAEKTAMSEVLGIDLYAITKNKKEVATLVRGKDQVLTKIAYYNQGWRERYCYFNFQVKKK